MTTIVRRSVPLMIACLVVMGFLAGTAGAQELKSAALAKELVQLMEQGKLDAIAAKTSEADTFVAALYLPGQLLVVRAKYQPAVLLNEKLIKKDYREVYTDLQSAAVAGTRLFVMDVGADGLKPKKEDARFDTADIDTRTVVFDGEWKKAKLSEEEYLKSFADLEKRYADMLAVLVAQVKKGS